jgi:hypothetical protein
VYRQLDNEQVDQTTDQTGIDAAASDNTDQLPGPDQEEDLPSEYVEKVEPFIASVGGEPDEDLPALYVGDSPGQGDAVQSNRPASAPRFVDLGRVATADYGDPLAPGKSPSMGSAVYL